MWMVPGLVLGIYLLLLFWPATSPVLPTNENPVYITVHRCRDGQSIRQSISQILSYQHRPGTQLLLECTYVQLPGDYINVKETPEELDVLIQQAKTATTMERDDDAN